MINTSTDRVSLRAILAVIVCGTTVGVLLPLLSAYEIENILVLAFLVVPMLVVLVLISPRWALIGYVVFIPLFSILTSRLEGSSFAAGGKSFSVLNGLKDAALIALVIGSMLSMTFRPHRIAFPKGVWVLLFEGIALVYAFRSPSIGVGLWAFRSVFEFTLIYVLVANLLQEQDSVIVLKAMLVGGVVVMVYGLVLWSTDGQQLRAVAIPGAGIHIIGRLTAFGNYTSAGAYATYVNILLIIAVAFTLYPSFGFRRPALASLFLIVPTLVLTFERRGWIGAVLGLILVGVFAKRVRLVVISACLGMAIATLLAVRLDVRDLLLARLTDDLGRTVVWASYWNQALESGFLGAGLGVAGNAVLAFTDAYIFTPHNYFLLLLVQGGVPLLFAFCTMASILLWQGWGKLSHATDHRVQLGVVVALSVLISLLAQSFFSDFLETFPLTGYFWFFAGLCVVQAGSSSDRRLIEREG